MQGESKVGINSFLYLFTIREAIGLAIILLAGFVTALILHLFHVVLTPFHTFVFFFSYFIIQLVIVGMLTSLEYNNLKYKIEENSVTLRQGVFSVEDETLPFIEIKDVQFKQSFFAQAFSVGQVIIETDKDTFYWFPIDKATAGQLQEAIGNRSDIKPITIQTENPQA